MHSRRGAGADMADVHSTELRRDAEGQVRHGAEWLLLWADPDAVRSAPARARAVADARAAAAAERAVAGALRAVAGCNVGVGFGGEAEAGCDGATIRLPALPRPPTADAVSDARGCADALAARLRHHDPRLDAGHLPEEPESAALFAAAEQARCEALAARHLPGLLHNIEAHAAARLDRLGFGHALLAADLPLAEALAVLLRRRFAGGAATLPSLGLQMWDHWLRAHLAAQLAAMATALDDQACFAAAAAAFVAALREALGRTTTPSPPGAPLVADGAGEPDDAPSHRPASATPHPQASEDDAAAASAPGPAAPARARDGERLPVAFTTRHDRVVQPFDLCTETELLRLRGTLDAETGAARGLLARLANQLQRQLLAQQRRSWDFDLEEGLLDAGRLDRVVISPAAPLSFKQERESQFRDTVVALLIDCSGSMRGRPIRLAAVAADVIARALERCGVACEVLGFTTADFAGGQSMVDWVAAGRPPHPGRLGDLRHIVLKPADLAWRAAKLGFGLLLRPDLLRENVDGEALAWAHERLLARPERRRILLVISDGAPAEAATGQVNPPGFLDRHLARTIAAIEAAGAVELRAIGIRHDVSRHYRRAVMLPDARMVGPALIAELAAAFAPARRRTTRP